MMEKKPVAVEFAETAKAIEAYSRETVKRLDAGTARDCADIYPDFKSAVERLSGGTNTVLLDDAGMPSVMVRVNQMTNSDLFDGASSAVHPAFLAGKTAMECVYCSKYQNIVRNGRAYSLPMQDAAAGIGYDDAYAFSRRKGRGWGLMPFSLRGAVAQWARKHGTMPTGNNDSGHDYFHPEETGLPVADGRVLTGSGPLTWSHNGMPDGIYDLNGNLNEWDSGVRIVDGEIQIMDHGAFALSANDTEEPGQWSAIMPDGTLAALGTQGALVYRGGVGGGIVLASSARGERGTYNCAFADIQAEEGLAVPEMMKALMLYPDEPGGDYGAGWRWIKDIGECRPLCGGAYRATDHAGVFFVGMTYPRSHSYGLSGFRSVYIPEK